jgi:hypothetical protein
MKQFNDVSKVALLLLALATPAVAESPIFIENPTTPFLITAANGCGTFDVQLTPEAGKPNGGEAIVFSNGNAIFAGPTFVTLTNTTTGKSINVNISGPTKFNFTSNTVVQVNLGLTLVTGNLPQYPANFQGIVLADGRIVSTFDLSTGNLISATFTGATTNLCPLLE